MVVFTEYLSALYFKTFIYTMCIKNLFNVQQNRCDIFFLHKNVSKIIQEMGLILHTNKIHQ